MKEGSYVQDRTGRGSKQKTKPVNEHGNNNMDNYTHVRNLSTTEREKTSKEALDFKMFAENLIRNKMSSVDTNHGDNSPEENDTSNITLKSLLSSVNTHEVKFMERFQAENLGSEIEILRAKNRELQLASTEKDRQIDLYQKQVDVLKNTLSKADKVNKEQARTIESLKQSLLKEMERFEDIEKKEKPAPSPGSKLGLTLQKKNYSNYISEFSHGRFNEKQYRYKSEGHSKGSSERVKDKSFAIYERGGVTITPVNCGNSKTPNGTYNTEYENNDERYTEELATIEPVIEMNCSDEDDEFRGGNEEGILCIQSPPKTNREEDDFKKGNGETTNSQENIQANATLEDTTIRT